MDNRIYDEILNEISECREDERNSQSQVVQIISTAGTVLGVILGTSVFGKGSIVGKEALFLLSTVVFCTACSYIVTLGVGNVLRYHYIQRLEDQLSLLNYGNDIEKISLVQWMSFTSPIMTRNPLHICFKYGFLHYFAYTLSVISAILFSVGVTFFLYYNLDKHTIVDKISMLILGVVFVFCLFCYIIISFNGRQISEKVFMISIENKKKRLKQNVKNKKTEVAKALMYFIYPKCKDFQKMFLIILGFIMGIFLVEGYIDVSKIKNNFGQLIFSIIVIDFLLYQARYQWNDIRGIEEDRFKIDRLPIKLLGEKCAIITSLIVICIRLLVIVCIFCHIIDNSIFISMCINAGFVIMLSIIYEWVRSREYVFWTFFIASLGYPLRIFAGICAAYPTVAKQILIALSNLLFELLRMVNLSQVYIDKSNHFSLSVMFAFMSAYAFMGAFSIVIPWLYEAIEEKRKFGKIRKKHYEYLLSEVKVRYQKYVVEGNGNATTLICSKGKISDIWNCTYIASILIFSFLFIVDCYHFNSVNFFIIIILELLFIISSVCICIFPNTRKKQRLALSFLGIILIIKFIFCFINFGIVTYYLFIFCNQTLISLIYFFLRYYFRDDFNFLKECKKALIKLFVLIIGEDAWTYLCK